LQSNDDSGLPSKIFNSFTKNSQFLILKNFIIKNYKLPIGGGYTFGSMCAASCTPSDVWPKTECCYSSNCNKNTNLSSGLGGFSVNGRGDTRIYMLLAALISIILM